jgi:hypothetical protein
MIEHIGSIAIAASITIAVSIWCKHDDKTVESKAIREIEWRYKQELDIRQAEIEGLKENQSVCLVKYNKELDIISRKLELAESVIEKTTLSEAYRVLKERIV